MRDMFSGVDEGEGGKGMTAGKIIEVKTPSECPFRTWDAAEDPVCSLQPSGHDECDDPGERPRGCILELFAGVVVKAKG